MSEERSPATQFIGGEQRTDPLGPGPWQDPDEALSSVMRDGVPLVGQEKVDWLRAMLYELKGVDFLNREVECAAAWVLELVRREKGGEW